MPTGSWVVWLEGKIRRGMGGAIHIFLLEFEPHATDATKHLGPEYHNLFVKPLGWRRHKVIQAEGMIGY